MRTRSKPRREGEPSASYWFVALEHALSIGDERRASDARAELAKRGVAVVVEASSPLRLRERPEVGQP